MRDKRETRPENLSPLRASYFRPLSLSSLVSALTHFLRFARVPRVAPFSPISPCIMTLFGFLMLGIASTVQADGEILAFAVVNEVPKDKAQVSAKVSINDVVSDMKLLASETILNNLIWKKLEICHAMKLYGFKAAEGFQVVTVHVIDAGLLPMSLQSFAGDCLIKKAIEIAPLVD